MRIDAPLSPAQPDSRITQEQRGAGRAPAVRLARSGRPPPPPPPAPFSIDFGVLLRTLRRRSYIIVAMTLAGVALGSVAQSQLKPRYTSSVELLIDPKRADSFGAETQFGAMYVDFSKIASVVSIMESSDLLERVARQLHLEDDPDFGGLPKPGLRDRIRNLPFVTALLGTPLPVEMSTAVRKERAVAKLQQVVRADRVGVTYVLTISASADRPTLARDIAEAVVGAYLDDQVAMKTTATVRDSAWLTERLQDAGKQLMQSEQAVEDIRRKFGLLEISGGGQTIDQQRVGALNEQLMQARSEVATRKAQYDQATQLRAAGGNLETLPEVASSPVISNLRKAQADVNEKLAHLKAIYKPGFFDIRQLQDNQAALQAEIDAEVGRLVTGIRNQYQNAVARADDLAAQLQHLSSDESGAKEAEGRIELRNAQRAVQANQALYESLANRRREVQQQETREEPEARVISKGTLPDRPSSPKPFLFPIAGGMAFLLMGLGLTIAPPLFDRRFVSVGEVERRLGLPVLGTLPLLKRRDLSFARRKSSARRRSSIVDYTARLPLSSFAESLRMVRAYLRVSTDGAPAIIHIASATGSEGKSTLAGAFAVSAASAGVRTALVDVDLRTASLSSMFSIRNKIGVTDVLDGRASLGEALHNIGSIPLAIIGAGSAAMQRPDVLDSDRFGEFLRDLAEDYNLIVLDGPPVLPVSDALVISRYADATIVVVKWRATAKALVEQTVKMLRRVDANVMGVILNKVDFTITGSSEYDNYVYQKKRADSEPIVRDL